MVLKNFFLSLKLFFKKTLAIFAKRLIWILIVLAVGLLSVDGYVYYLYVYSAMEREVVGEAKVVRIKENLLREILSQIKTKEEKRTEPVVLPRDPFK